MNNKQLLAYYGLKWNPFLPNIPVEALWHSPQMNSFIFRLENMTMNGGFALISGEPGLGKSKTLQIIAQGDPRFHAGRDSFDGAGSRHL